MPLSPSDFAAGIKKISNPKDIADTAQKWTDAWESYISKCTQIAVATAGVAAFKSAIPAAFVPVPAPPVFFTLLQAAMTAGLSAVVLKPNYGVTLVPNLLAITVTVLPLIITPGFVVTSFSVWKVILLVTKY